MSYFISDEYGLTESGFPLSFEELSAIVNDIADEACDHVGCPYECAIEVIFTGDEAIREMNREKRNLDKATDVLSFPMLSYETPGDLSFLAVEEEHFEVDDPDEEDMDKDDSDEEDSDEEDSDEEDLNDEESDEDESDEEESDEDDSDEEESDEEESDEEDLDEDDPDDEDSDEEAQSRVNLDCFDPDSGELVLGDIVISLDHALAQAEEYGHSVRREVAFLIAHSMLHLFGYDHMEEDDRLTMERMQEEILQKRGYSRND